MGFLVQGKVALVTGANRGIGKAIVTTLLARGAAKVYAAVRKLSSAAELAQAGQGRVVAVELDLSKPDTIAAAARRATDVQLVVNNAGVLQVGDLLAAEAIDALKFENEVNVYGLIRMAQAFAPVLASQGGGALVQLNSVASLKTFPDFATYCASKAAAYALTQALRARLKPQGTLVVSVHPGPIATDMADSAGLAGVAEPPSVVAEAIVAALAAGEFHAFPDSYARDMWSEYQSFAKKVIETDATEK